MPTKFPVGVTRASFIAHLVRTGCKPEDAERAADRTFKSPDAPTIIGVGAGEMLVAECNDPALSVPIRAKRKGDALWMEIQTPPRTKKNNAETLGSSKSKPFKAYALYVTEAIEQVHDALRLPLPDRKPLGYNIAAHFYVDVRGEAADQVGLEQALYDVLQAAGVVSNDWLFRQHDGSRVILDAPRPRVAFLITPIVAQTLPSLELPE